MLLFWDVTCPNTFSPSYSSIAMREVGAVAALAEERKNAEHECLNSAQNFTPVVIEPSGVVWVHSWDFLRDLVRCLARFT